MVILFYDCEVISIVITMQATPDWETMRKQENNLEKKTSINNFHCHQYAHRGTTGKLFNN